MDQPPESQGFNREIEEILGYTLPSELKGTITNLNDVPMELVKEARKLSYSQIIHFLSHYLSSNLFKHIPEFIEDVVKNEEDPSTWRKGRTLLPYFRLNELLTLNVHEILSPLQPKPDEHWMRMRVDKEKWEENDFTAGAPAVYRPEPNYIWTPPEHVMEFVPLDSKYVETVSDITIACRRWIALNIALHLYNCGMFGKVYDKQTIINSIKMEQINLSPDASIALNALIIELNNFENRKKGAPGYMGVDELYSL